MTTQATKIDDVSMMLGELRRAVSDLDAYVHDARHDENNRRQADQFFQDKVLKTIEKIRADMEAVREKDAHALAAVRLADQKAVEDIKMDVANLKAINTRREGMIGALDWFLKSPLVGWAVAICAAAWASITGRLHL